MSAVQTAWAEDNICSICCKGGADVAAWEGEPMAAVFAVDTAGKTSKTTLLEFFGYVNASVGNPISSQDRLSFPRWCLHGIQALRPALWFCLTTARNAGSLLLLKPGTNQPHQFNCLGQNERGALWHTPLTEPRRCSQKKGMIPSLPWDPNPKPRDQFKSQAVQPEEEPPHSHQDFPQSRS